MRLASLFKLHQVKIENLHRGSIKKLENQSQVQDPARHNLQKLDKKYQNQIKERSEQKKQKKKLDAIKNKNNGKTREI